MHSQRKETTHLLILPETLSVLSLLSFFLNILEAMGGGPSRGPTKKENLSVSLLLLLCLPHPAAATLLSLCFLSHTLKHTHSHVSTVLSAGSSSLHTGEQVCRRPDIHRAEEDRTDLFPRHSPFLPPLVLPFLFTGALTHSQTSPREQRASRDTPCLQRGGTVCIFARMRIDVIILLK